MNCVIRLNYDYDEDDNNKLSFTIHTTEGEEEKEETKDRAGYKCSLSSYRGSFCFWAGLGHRGWHVCAIVAGQLSQVISYLWVWKWVNYRGWYITSIPGEDNRGWEHRIGGWLSNNERRSLLGSLRRAHVQILHKVNAKRTECTPYYKFVCSGVEGLLHPEVLGRENRSVRMMKMVGGTRE